MDHNEDVLLLLKRTLEPPSPTSTASSKSPVTPIFDSSFFEDSDDDDGIMTFSGSELGNVSEYSSPRSLSAYVQQGRSRKGRKSSFFFKIIT